MCDENIEYKECYRCEKSKPFTLEFFTKKRGKVNGLCRECRQAAYGAEYQKQKREQLPAIKEFKRNLAAEGNEQCRKCNKIFPHLPEYFRIHKEKLDNLCISCEKDRKIRKSEGTKRCREQTLSKRELIETNEPFTCNQCGQTKDLNKQNFVPKEKRFLPLCRDCDRANNREKYDPIKKRDEYLKHQEKNIAYSREYHKKNYSKNKESILAKRKLPENKKRRNENRLARKKVDVNFKLQENYRARLRAAVQGIGFKVGKSKELLGCEYNFLRSHLESQFSNGMSWENYGFGDDKWHVDHVIPIGAFVLTLPEHQKLAFHWTNLQPRWQTDNVSKNDKILFNGQLIQSRNLTNEEKIVYIKQLVDSGKLCQPH